MDLFSLICGFWNSLSVWAVLLSRLLFQLKNVIFKRPKLTSFVWETNKKNQNTQTVKQSDFCQVGTRQWLIHINPFTGLKWTLPTAAGRKIRRNRRPFCQGAKPTCRWEDSVGVGMFTPDTWVRILTVALGFCFLPHWPTCSVDK